MVSVTPKAQDKLKEVLDSSNTPDASVRVGVVRGPHGCVHGWKIGIDSRNPLDKEFEVGQVRILVEPGLEEALNGATIDYMEDPIGTGFTIDVPSAPLPVHENGASCHH